MCATPAVLTQTKQPPETPRNLSHVKKWTSSPINLLAKPVWLTNTPPFHFLNKRLIKRLRIVHFDTLNIIHALHKQAFSP
jgi:hypothetical protein